jgi:hypothetical protein
VPEPIGVWWARRQWSRGLAVPYAIGEYRRDWASYPVLIRQYHPERNSGIVLTQVPPAAEVYVTWECDVGHVFVATPAEQRGRPGRERRQSVWCPECAVLAKPRPWLRLPDDWPAGVPAPQRVERTTGRQTIAAAPGRGRRAPASASASAPNETAGSAPLPLVRSLPGRPARRRPRTTELCPKTPRIADGTPFVSACAPPPASAAEAQLRADLAERLEYTEGMTAIRLARPFFDHVEAWPDIIVPELRIAIEYDSTGRHGLEHVGPRTEIDARKDRLVRAVGWEVIRIRTGRLQALGPYDLEVSGTGRRTLDSLFDRFREVRGPLFVDAYLRR